MLNTSRDYLAYFITYTYMTRMSNIFDSNILY